MLWEKRRLNSIQWKRLDAFENGILRLGIFSLSFDEASVWFMAITSSKWRIYRIWEKIVVWNYLIWGFRVFHEKYWASKEIEWWFKRWGKSEKRHGRLKISHWNIKWRWFWSNLDWTGFMNEWSIMQIFLTPNTLKQPTFQTTI